MITTRQLMNELFSNEYIEKRKNALHDSLSEFSDLTQVDNMFVYCLPNIFFNVEEEGERPAFVPDNSISASIPVPTGYLASRLGEIGLLNDDFLKKLNQCMDSLLDALAKVKLRDDGMIPVANGNGFLNRELAFPRDDLCSIIRSCCKAGDLPPMPVLWLWETPTAYGDYGQTKCAIYWKGVWDDGFFLDIGEESAHDIGMEAMGARIYNAFEFMGNTPEDEMTRLASQLSLELGHSLRMHSDMTWISRSLRENGRHRQVRLSVPPADMGKIFPKNSAVRKWLDLCELQRRTIWSVSMWAAMNSNHWIEKVKEGDMPTLLMGNMADSAYKDFFASNLKFLSGDPIGGQMISAAFKNSNMGRHGLGMIDKFSFGLFVEDMGDELRLIVGIAQGLPLEITSRHGRAVVFTHPCPNFMLKHDAVCRREHAAHEIGKLVEKLCESSRKYVFPAILEKRCDETFKIIDLISRNLPNIFG